MKLFAVSTSFNQVLLFHATLLYNIHFSSPLTIWQRTGSCLCRASKKTHAATTQQHFSVMMCDTQTLNLFTIPIFLKCQYVVDLGIPKTSAILYREFFDRALCIASSLLWEGLPRQLSSERLKFPSRYLTNHLRCDRGPSPFV